MNKRSYKRHQNRLYREIKARKIAEGKIKAAMQQAESEKERAEYYQRRFRALGSNVKTIEPDNGKILQMVKWELSPEVWGHYEAVNNSLLGNEYVEDLKRELVSRLVDGLVENELVQFISKGQDEYDLLGRYSTIAAKLYVVPWEQVPHKRTVELKQYVDDYTDWKNYL